MEDINNHTMLYEIEIILFLYCNEDIVNQCTKF